MYGGRWEFIADEEVFQVVCLGLPVSEHQCQPLRGIADTLAHKLGVWETLVMHRT